MNPSATIRFVAEGRKGFFGGAESKDPAVSYPILPPSAAIALCESILLKPDTMRYIVKSISLLSKTLYMGEIRNSIGFRREQKQSTREILVEPAFLIVAEIQSILGSREKHHNIIALQEMFERYLERGRYRQQPYFGCSDYICDLRPAKDGDLKRIQTDVNDELRMHVMQWPSGLPTFFNAQIKRGTMLVPNFTETKGE